MSQKKNKLKSFWATYFRIKIKKKFHFWKYLEEVWLIHFLFKLSLSHLIKFCQTWVGAPSCWYYILWHETSETLLSSKSKKLYVWTHYLYKMVRFKSVKWIYLKFARYAIFWLITLKLGFFRCLSRRNWKNVSVNIELFDNDTLMSW